MEILERGVKKRNEKRNAQPSISEVAARKMNVFISNWGKLFAHWSRMTVSTRDRLHNSSYVFQINAPTITLTLHCSLIMVGGYEKQSDSNTTSTSSSASAPAVSADWDITPPLQNVRVNTQYVGILRNKFNELKSFRKNWLSSIVSNVEHCQWMQAGGRMFWGHQRRWVWPQQTT